jgi:hypothetical protein
MQLAEAVDQRLMRLTGLLDTQAGVLVHQAGQHFPELLFVAAPRRADGQAMHRRREVQRLQVEVLVLLRVMQHGVEGEVVYLGDGA